MGFKMGSCGKWPMDLHYVVPHYHYNQIKELRKRGGVPGCRGPPFHESHVGCIVSNAVTPCVVVPFVQGGCLARGPFLGNKRT